MLVKARTDATMVVRYEDITVEPERIITELRSRIPLLEGVRADAEIKVKDYGAQKLRNLNAAQIGSLSGTQVHAISKVLSDNHNLMDELSYEIL